MLFLWSILIVLLLFLIICIGILRFHATQVQERQALLEEALWKRRHKIPLLLEVIGDGGQTTGGRQDLIDLRNKVSSGVYLLSEQIDLEKEMSDKLREVFQQVSSNTLLKSDSAALSLQKEFTDVLEGIRIAENDYNYTLQKFRKLMRWPWFKIFGFAFQISKNHPVKAL